MGERYPELQPGTLHRDDLGLWCVLDRREADFGTGEPPIEIKIMAIHTTTMQQGGQEWLHEDDIEVSHSGEVEVIDDSELAEIAQINQED